MRAKIHSWMISAALLVAALAIAWSLRASSLYRGYLQGRDSGALVFSIVQAVSTEADPHQRHDPASCPRFRLAERLRQMVSEPLFDFGLQPRRS